MKTSTKLAHLLIGPLEAPFSDGTAEAPSDAVSAVPPGLANACISDRRPTFCYRLRAGQSSSYDEIKGSAVGAGAVAAHS